MEPIALAIIILLLLALVCLVMYFSYLQQNSKLDEINARLSKLQPYPSQRRDPKIIRQQRAASCDHMMLLEAALQNSQREDLTPEELQAIDAARDTFKVCADELKNDGEWMGVPFDLEWFELLERLPIVKRLYRASEFSVMGESTLVEEVPIAIANQKKPDSSA